MRIRHCARVFQGLHSATFVPLAASASLPAPALPAAPAAAQPTLTVIVITRLTREVCVGDSIPVTVSVDDLATMTPVSGATVTFNFGYGAGSQTTGADGMASMLYSSEVPGPVTLTATATKDGYTSGSDTYSFEVKKCSFEVEMFYFGSYQGKDGVWRYIEDAFLPPTPLVYSGGTLTGSGRGHFSYLAYIQKLTPGVQCTKFKSDDYAEVQIQGHMENGQVTLTFAGDKAKFTGPSEFACSYLGEMLAGLGLPGLTWDFTFAPETIVVPSSGGTRTIRLSQGAYFPMVPGRGAAIFTVRRTIDSP